VLGLVTEVLTVRPVLKSIEQHLYVLSTLAFALMVQQVTAIECGTEAQPFPVLFPIDPNSGWLSTRSSGCRCSPASSPSSASSSSTARR
jgi:branched-chain amino acid transport system permease protein